MDTLYYQRMYSENSSTAAVSKQIKAQLRSLVEQGHRIELHLHPHWLDAVYKNGYWKFPSYAKYRLQTLDSGTIMDCFMSGKQVLEDIAREVDSEYYVQAFRAGGLCVQPFEKLVTGFQKSGIKIDSSVAPGMQSNGDVHFYDYSKYGLLDPYRFERYPDQEDCDGSYIELPVSTYKRNIFDTLTFRLTKFFDPKKFSKYGDGNGVKQPVSFVDIISGKYVFLSIDDTTYRILKQKMGSSSVESFTFLSHTKELSPTGLEIIRKLAESGDWDFRLTNEANP